MKNLDGLISILNLFKVQYELKKDLLPKGSQRMQFSEQIALWFEPCAERILAGHFRITNTEGEKTLVRMIKPTAIELYFHEEGEGRFKDPIMYHTNDRKVWNKASYFRERGIEGLPYYPVGSLNPHTSGIDITFENAKEHYRASFLIREYKVTYESGREAYVKNATEIYDDMLLNGIPLDNADWVEWCDGDGKVEITRGWRRNVPDYIPKRGEPGKWEPNPEPDPSGKYSFATPKGRFIKCPFGWQFRTKDCR